MPQFKIKVQWEAIVDADDEDDAEFQYFKGLEEDGEILENIVSDSLTIEELKQ